MEQTEQTQAATSSQTATDSGAAQQQQSQSAGAQSAATKMWHDSLSAELKDNASLKRFNDVESLAKSYVHLEKNLGNKNTVTIPDEKYATDEDYKNVFRKLGLPESHDKVELKVPDGADKDFLNEYKKFTWDNNILPKQAQKMLDWYNGKVKALQDARVSQEATVTNDAINSLKKEYGNAFDVTIQKARAAVNHYGSQELKQFLDSNNVGGVPLSSHPAMVKMFVKLSETLKEGQFKGESYYSNRLSPKEAEQKARQILADPAHPYNVKGHPNHDAAVREVQEYWTQATT